MLTDSCGAPVCSAPAAGSSCVCLPPWMLPRKVQAAWQGREADARRDAPTARQQALLGDPQAQAQQRRAPAARLTRAPPCLPGWPRAPRGGSWAPPRAACPPRPAANPPRCPQSRQRPAMPCAATPERMAGASGVFLRTGVEQFGSSGRAASLLAAACQALQGSMSGCTCGSAAYAHASAAAAGCGAPERRQQPPARGAEAALQRVRQRRRGKLKTGLERSERRPQRAAARARPEARPEQRRHRGVPQRGLQRAHQLHLCRVGLGPTLPWCGHPAAPPVPGRVRPCSILVRAPTSSACAG